MNLDEQCEVIYNSRPKLKFCEWFDESSSLWNFTRHSHPYIELIYFVDGKGAVNISGTTVSFSLYDVTLCPAHMEHLDEKEAARRREIICLWIDIPELIIPDFLRIHEQDSILKNAFLKVYQEAKREKPNSILLEYAIKILLIEVLRAESESKEEGQFLDCVLEYIQNHCIEKISLDELAKLEHVSKSWLSRKFRQRTGSTVISYINRLRVERAKQFLVDTDLDVSEIAYQLGFENPKYFYRVFKEQVGESPAAFRRNCKNLRGGRTEMSELFYFTGGYTEPTLMGSGETVPGRCRGISCFSFDEESGMMKLCSVTKSTPNPSYILADPRAPYLYCVNELKEYGGIPGSTVSVYHIEADNGELQLLNRQFTGGADACFLALSPDGSYLMATNYHGGNFCVFPLEADHRLGSASCLLRHVGRGMDVSRQESPHPHQLLCSPDGGYVYVTDLALDRLLCYQADWKNGWLIPCGRQDIAGIPGQGVRHAVFDAAGEHLYVMTEMACQINVYNYNPESGAAELVQTLSTVSAGDAAFCLGAAIRLHPCGRWLYVSVRGVNRLYVFSVRTDGLLEFVQDISSGGEIPRDFVLSPDGRFLLVGNQDTDNICIFAVDLFSGALTYHSEVRDVGGVTVLALWKI